jgi:hypothetical protein
LSTQSRTPRAAATPARSNPAPPSAAEGSPSAIPVFRPPEPDRWLEAARASALDLVAAAREGARRPGKRVLSRAEIRRQARDAFARLSTLHDHAAESLRRLPPPSE